MIYQPLEDQTDEINLEWLEECCRMSETRDESDEDMDFFRQQYYAEHQEQKPKYSPFDDPIEYYKSFMGK